MCSLTRLNQYSSAFEQLLCLYIRALLLQMLGRSSDDPLRNIQSSRNQLSTWQFTHHGTSWPVCWFAYKEKLINLWICLLLPVDWFAFQGTIWPPCRFAYHGLIDKLVDLNTMDYLTNLSICIPPCWFAYLGLIDRPLIGVQCPVHSCDCPWASWSLRRAISYFGARHKLDAGIAFGPFDGYDLKQ